MKEIYLRWYKKFIFLRKSISQFDDKRSWTVHTDENDFMKDFNELLIKIEYSLGPDHPYKHSIKDYMIRATDSGYYDVAKLRYQLDKLINDFEEDFGFNPSMSSVSEVTKSANVNYSDKKIFVGHGGSHYWRELKDFLVDKLDLQCIEFNSKPVAGRQTSDRLNEMLNECGFAFLIMSAEDEQLDGSFSARDNVIHEVGLFQGRLGMEKAIILLEEGCNVFSNIHGLTVITFKEKISNCFEEVRDVLKRENIIVLQKNL